MRVIVAGSRTITSFDDVVDAIEQSGFKIDVLLSGACPKGVDALGEQWAKANGVPVERYPANWDEHGRAAGPIRNAEMARNADALVVVWDGASRGTKSMIDEAKKRGLKTFVVCITS